MIRCAPIFTSASATCRTWTDLPSLRKSAWDEGCDQNIAPPSPSRALHSLPYCFPTGLVAPADHRQRVGASMITDDRLLIGVAPSNGHDWHVPYP
jgi:hypothetical protein